MYLRNKSLFVPTALIACMAFDADAFMSQSYDGELDTQILQVPEGDYRAMIGDIDSEKSFRTFTAKKGPNEGKEFTLFQPAFVIQDDPRLAEVKASRGDGPIIVFHKGMFLDLSEQGGLDFSKGKNVDLGKLRDAVGQNSKPGWTFKDLSGAGPVMVQVIHEADANDDTKKYARVKRVVKIS